jgi:tight adherence protein C
MSGALLGLCTGLAMLLIAARMPWRRRPTLAGRVDPWLRESPMARAVAPRGLLESTLRPTVTDLARRVDSVLGGSASVQRRLVLAGDRTTLEQLRGQQVLLGSCGLGLGAAGLVLRGATGAGPPPAAGLALTLAFVIGGVMGRDWWLSRAVLERAARVSTELPAVAELLALAVAAGEGMGGALDRVARMAGGELGGELRRALGETRAGGSLGPALQGVGVRTGVPAVVRFTDSIATALERGTPLADVLRAQAADAREATRRELLESGGKKEIAMLFPVVFLVLPTVVLFAIYPAIVGLSVVVR